jgi:Porin subfamily
MIFGRGALLGAAVGAAAMASALAADLPTKSAAPAEYAKVCNVSGMAGFILPGSGACFKISGYVAGQIAASNPKQGFDWRLAPGEARTVSTGGTKLSSFDWSVQSTVSFDARQDTAFGVLRGYADLRFDNGAGFDNAATSAHVERAYVQWGGITVGKANSFFSFFGR